jgi:hypothetical protein
MPSVGRKHRVLYGRDDGCERQEHTWSEGEMGGADISSSRFWRMGRASDEKRFMGFLCSFKFYKRGLNVVAHVLVRSAELLICKLSVSKDNP